MIYLSGFEKPIIYLSGCEKLMIYLSGCGKPIINLSGCENLITCLSSRGRWPSFRQTMEGSSRPVSYGDKSSLQVNSPYWTYRGLSSFGADDRNLVTCQRVDQTHRLTRDKKFSGSWEGNWSSLAWDHYIVTRVLWRYPITPCVCVCSLSVIDKKRVFFSCIHVAFDIVVIQC